MAIQTTTIGAYPKPDYVPTPDWFRVGGTGSEAPTKAFDDYLKNLPDNIDEIHDRATHEIIQDQINVGIDIPTDGEIRRENYIHYQCRNFDGFDFTNLTKVSLRNGAWVAEVPTITGPIHARDPILPRDYVIAQAATNHPVKITLPGPMTISGSTADAYYGDEAKLDADLAKALNQEVLALAAAGCTWIQIDEPVFARNTEKALAFGFENLERCFDGLPGHVTRTVHMCCGYPDRLDQDDFAKADLMAYFRLADAIDASSIQVVSIEDAHRYNNLTLLEAFRSTTVIFGSIGIARTRVETVEEIEARLRQALEHIDAERLIVGPDCGLGMLPREIVLAKLENMVTAVRRIG